MDFARPQDDLSQYRLVIVPSLYLVTDDAVANIERFVRGGAAVLLMTFFSGIVGEFEHIRLGGYPNPFATVNRIGRCIHAECTSVLGLAFSTSLTG